MKEKDITFKIFEITHSGEVPIEKTIEIERTEAVLVYGVQEKNLKLLDKHYPEIRITARGNTVKLLGQEQDVEVLSRIFRELENLAIRNGEVNELDVHTILALHDNKIDSNLSKGEESGLKNLIQEDPHKVFYKQPDDIITFTYQSKPITCKTRGQKQLFESSMKNDIVFALGPAGTGKTFTSVAIAIRALKERRVRRIILARPAVEAGENLGFLPGDLKEKIDPYLRPLYDALEDILEAGRLKMHMEKNVVEIAPLAYMRGRTLNDAFVILDEAQNTTFAQLKMFLTRIGQNSKCIITGDMTQTDLPRSQKSGLVSMPKLLGNIEGIDFVHLEQTDILRHALVRKIIDAYDRYENDQGTSDA